MIEAVEVLVNRYGWHFDRAIRLTPRQITVILFAARRREKYEAADRLSLTAIASQGDNKAIQKQLKDLTEE